MTTERKRFSPLALGQVKAIEDQRDQLADELRKAIATIEQQAALIASLRAENDRLCAMLGEADAKLTDPPKGGDA
jgi:cell shape-determining protein MreC